jgi:hypothetical protein
VPHSQSSLAFLTQLFGIFSYEMHTILRSNVIVFTLNAKPELQWQILNKNISQKFSPNVLFLDLKFC